MLVEQPAPSEPAMMPTWNAATYRPEAPSGSSGQCRMAADCSSGGIAVAAAPHKMMAATPVNSVPSVPPVEAEGGQHHEGERQRGQAADDRGLGTAIARRASSAIAVRPAMP